jgi:[calcium/calmodulin-dependent protein kinase] kinase
MLVEKTCLSIFRDFPPNRPRIGPSRVPVKKFTITFCSLHMFETPHSLAPIPVVETLSLHGHVRKVNNYLLAARIGSGSSSTVYAAIDTTTNRQVAVKRIKLHELMRTTNGIGQLEREVGLIRHLNHPNILKLFEVLHDAAHGEVYIVLEYAQKGSLGGFLERGQALSRDAVFGIIHQVAVALKYLHGLGYVHQDIKPGNVLVDSAGRALLADFGIGHSFASAGMVVGSPAFQAPEALDDSYSDGAPAPADGPQKEDVWALGVTLYQLLFMELPFVGTNLYEVVNDIMAHPLEVPAGTSDDVADLLRGMLCVDPLQRMGVDQVLANPLLSRDRTYELPPTPEPEAKEGPVIRCRAETCGDGFSFAKLTVNARRRFSQKAFAAMPRTKLVKVKAFNSTVDLPVITDRPIVKK